MRKHISLAELGALLLFQLLTTPVEWIDIFYTDEEG